MICGFVQPSKGKMFYNNKEINSTNIREFRKNISYISQGVDLPAKIVSEYLDEIQSYSNNKERNFDRDKLIKYLNEFELKENILKKNIKDLSGGERQRLSFIIAISLERDILLLDEITSGLDEELKLKVINFIEKINKTVLVVSHDRHWNSVRNLRKLRW